MRKLFFLYLSLFSIITVSAQNTILLSEKIENIFSKKTEIQFKFTITSKTEISICIDNHRSCITQDYLRIICFLLCFLVLLQRLR